MFCSFKTEIVLENVLLQFNMTLKALFLIQDTLIELNPFNSSSHNSDSTFDFICKAKALKNWPMF